MADHDGMTGSWLSRRRTMFGMAAAIWMSFVLIHVVQSFVGAEAIVVLPLVSEQNGTHAQR